MDFKQHVSKGCISLLFFLAVILIFGNIAYDFLVFSKLVPIKWRIESHNKIRLILHLGLPLYSFGIVQSAWLTESTLI